MNQGKSICKHGNTEPWLCKECNLIRMEINEILQDVFKETETAVNQWPKFNSVHEGYAVLAEEVDELWQHVKTNQKKRKIAEMKKECIQVAAMAVRFSLEICNEKDGRK